MTSCTIEGTVPLADQHVVKGFQVKIFDELYHPLQRSVNKPPVVKGFQVKIFDELYHRVQEARAVQAGCERLSGQDL